MIILRFLFIMLAMAAIPGVARAGTVASPDGRIVATLTVDGEGKPVYSVTLDGAPLIGTSTLGFNLADEDPLRRNFAMVAETAASADSTWEQPWGERRFVRDRHNELAVTFRQQDDAARGFTVRLRVFDDGFGFRYELPERADRPEWRIADELTEFVIVPRGTAWWVQAGDWNRYEQI